MSPVTEKDLSRFRDAGFEAPAFGSEHVASDELWASVLRAVASPSARLLQAVYLALQELAERDDLQELSTETLDPDAKRLLGYTAARAAEDLAESATAKRLRSLADSLYRPEFSNKNPLTVSSVRTDSYLRILVERSDEMSRRWNVYGDVSPHRSAGV